MNASELKSRAPFLPADVAASVARAMLHVRGAAVALGVPQNDQRAVWLGCASMIPLRQDGQPVTTASPAPATLAKTNVLPFPSSPSANQEDAEMSPSVRELLEASDNPALPPYLAGIEAAMALQNAIGDAHLLGLEYALACKATARGFADQMPADLLTDCGDCLQKQAAPFWGHDGIPALDKVDAQMLAAWLAEQGGEHE